MRSTGKALWQFDPKVPGPAAAKNCCDVVSRGAAVYRGKVYVATYDGRLIALDAANGKPLWTAATVDPEAMYTISGAPRVGGGLVFIGNGGGEFGGRGYVSAYDADTGELAWRFFTTPGDPAQPDGAASDAIMASLVQPTWFGPHNDYRGGGMAWNSIVYDPEFGQLYLATGNGYPWPRLIRSEGKGDNLFICSVVAVDAKTGQYRWHYQETPGDSWDYDSVADMILADLNVGGVATQGADAHAEERLLLQRSTAGTENWSRPNHSSRAYLGIARGPRDGSAGRESGGVLHGQARAAEPG